MTESIRRVEKGVLEASGPREFQELARQHQLPPMSSWEDSPGADGLISCKAHSPLAQRWARGRGFRVQRRDDMALRRMAYPDVNRLVQP
jgi:hypothetical protein